MTAPLPPRRLLVVQLAEIGNALLIMPALQALRVGLPATRIDILTTTGGAAILRGAGLYDRLLLFDKHRFDRPRDLIRPANLWRATRLGRDLRAAAYDAVMLFHHLSTRLGALKYAAFCYATGAPRRLGLDNGRGFFLTDAVADAGYGVHHELDYALQLAGLLVPSTPRVRPPFEPGPEAAAVADDLLAPVLRRDRPLVAIYPGAGAYAPARRWPAPRFAELADRLVEDGLAIVLMGGPQERRLHESLLAQMRHGTGVLDLGGRTTLHEAVAILERCALFVGNDGGVLHLAATAGTPVVAPYGPTDPRAWGPWSPEPWQRKHVYPNGVEVLCSGLHTTLKATIACSPCIYRGTTLGTPNGCPDRTCLERITVDHLYETVSARLVEIAAGARRQYAVPAPGS